MKTKIWVALVALLLVFYLIVTAHRGWILLMAPEPLAKLLGAAVFLLPVVGVWALVREVAFGARMEKLARLLDAEGGLPPDTLPRTPAGRIVRAAADAEFEKYRAAAEAEPDDWRSWFRLSCAYDAAGDRRRARKSMRDAIGMYRRNTARV
ncbi:hypothetical protein [Arthrobacter pigmenti]